MGKEGNSIKSQKIAALLISSISSFINPFMSSSLNVALPYIGSDLGMDVVELSWVGTIYLLSSAVFLVPFGKIGDIYGRKKVFVFGMTVFTISTLLAIIADSSLIFLLARSFQGIGSALMFGTGVAILTSLYEPGERGKALGINVSVVYLGLSAGPFLGGMLTEYWGWKSLFIVNIPLCIFTLILIKTMLKGEWAESEDEKFDWKGSLLFAVALVCLVYGSTIITKDNGWLFASFGIVLMVVFVVTQFKIPFPVLNIKMFIRNTTFVYSCIAALINYAATNTITFFLSIYLQTARGLTPKEAGIILVTQPILMTLTSPLSGKISDIIEPRIIATSGMLLTTSGVFLLTFLELDTSIVYIVVVQIIIGLGFGLFSSPNMNTIMSSVARRNFGIASAMVGIMRLLGQMMSMTIATVVISILIGNVEIRRIESHQQIIDTIQLSFYIFTAISIFGVWASIARGKIRK